jgi:hypothetical protein
MTYREKLQEIIAAIEKANGQVNGLRDHAALNHKQYHNVARSHLFKALEALGTLDDKLSALEANSPL